MAAQAPNPADEPPVGRAKSLLRSFRFALAGVWYGVRTQRNVRVQGGLFLLALTLAVWLQFSPLEFAVLVSISALVLVAELFNTAIEAIVDLISPRYHPLARVAKDVAAGAVVTAAAASVAVGLLLFLPHLLHLLR